MIFQLRLCLDAQRVLGGIVAKAPPLVGLAVEDNGPFVLIGNGVQTVAAGRKFLAIDPNVVSDNELRCFVGARAPGVPPGHYRRVFRTSSLVVKGRLTFHSCL